MSSDSMALRLVCGTMKSYYYNHFEAMKKDVSNIEHRKVNKKSIIIGVVSIFMVVGIGLATFALLNRSDPPLSMEKAIDAMEERSIAQQLADAQLDIVITDAQKVGEATAELEHLLSEAESNEDREVYLSTLVTMYDYVENYEAALDCATRLEEIAPTDVSASMMARLHFSMENFIEAARFYQLAADRSEPTPDPTQASPYNNYMNSKRKAEGQVS